MSLAWTNSPVWLVINVLVAFRLTRLWVDDMLPPLPALRARIEAYATRDAQAVGDRYYRYNQTLDRYGQPPLMFLVNCYWCVGFWASLGVTLAASAIPATVWAWFAVPLALSALVGLLGRLD